METIKIGIIGGSGMDDPRIIKATREKKAVTPYGSPSSSLTIGTINGIDVVVLARHGRDHTIYPSGVNYRANIHALKKEGCTSYPCHHRCGVPERTDKTRRLCLCRSVYRFYKTQTPHFS